MARTVVYLTENEHLLPIFRLEEPSVLQGGRTYSLLFPLTSFTSDPNTGYLHIAQHSLLENQEVALRPSGPDHVLPGNIGLGPYTVHVVDEDNIQLIQGTTLIGKFSSPQNGTCYLYIWDAGKLTRMVTPTADPQAIGELLLNGLARHPAILSTLSSSFGLLNNQRVDPICLLFDEVAERTVENLRWECLYDSKVGFLALTPRWPIVRLKNPETTIQQTFAYAPPIRIFALLSATGPNIDASQEWQSLYEATKDHDVVVKVLTCQSSLIKSVNGLANWRFSAEQTLDSENVRTNFRQFAPQILHLFGHGDPLKGELYFGNLDDFRQNKSGSIRTTAATIRQFSSNALPVWITILNACGTGTATPDAASFAASLSRAGFPVVIGMSSDVASQHTQIFTRRYYESVMETLKTIPPWEFANVDWMSESYVARQAIWNNAPAQSNHWTVPLFYTRKAPFEILRIDEDQLQRTSDPGASKLSSVQTALNLGQKNTLSIEGLRKLIRS